MAMPITVDDVRQAQRRAFLSQATGGIGALALCSLLKEDSSGAAQPRHLAPRAKRVIHLCMAGGPSHLETWDYKPKLAEMNGQPMPASITAGQPIAQLQGKELVCLAPQHAFQRVGQSGQHMSVIFPHIAKIADDICIVRSLVTEQINHDPAQTFMNTGTAISGRPSMGSWVLYGLGSESQNLPGFVVMVSVGGGPGSAHRVATMAQRLSA